jgi:PAS domain S-box-containing protein
MYQLYGIKKGDFGGAYDAWIRTVHPEDKANTDGEIQAALRGEREYAPEFRIVRPDGSIRHIKADSRTFKDREGKPLRMIGTNIDLTERKQTEEILRRLNEELEQRVKERTTDLQTKSGELQDSQKALMNLVEDLNEKAGALEHSNKELAVVNKELEAFSYSVSHDLRSPLRAIAGFSQILLEDYAGKLDAEGQDNLHRICAASQRMGHLIDDLLNLSRVTRSELRQGRVDLSEIAGQIAAELQRAAPDRRGEFRIQPTLVAEGDPNLLRIVLENLLGNAWKFTGKQPVARVEFGATLRHGAPAFLVRDNGAGFDMAYAGKLFGAFQRFHSAADFPGNGVGLATVQRIIHRHGGQIEAESAVGQGATFYFTLSHRTKIL